MSKESDLRVYQIVVLGASKVGKTSMVSRYVNNYFDALTEETVNDFREYIKLVNLNKGEQNAPQYCALRVKDLFGIDSEDLKEDGDKEKQDLLKRYIKNELAEPTNDKDKEQQTKQKNKIYRDKKVYGYMFVYDVTNFDSLDKIAEFVDFIISNERKGYNLVTKKMLVGNKIDLGKRDQERVDKVIRDLKSKTGNKIQIMECSAYENNNVELCFEELARSIFTDVSFETFEIQEKKEEEERIAQANKDKAKEEKAKNKSNQGGGWFSCAAKRDGGDLDEEDENAEDPNSEENKKIQELPQMDVSATSGCSTF